MEWLTVLAVKKSCFSLTVHFYIKENENERQPFYIFRCTTALLYLYFFIKDFNASFQTKLAFPIYRLLLKCTYRVSYIEMSLFKWFWGVEGSKNFVSLKACSVVVGIWLLTLTSHASAKGWPPQPLKARVPNITEKMNF